MLLNNKKSKSIMDKLEILNQFKNKYGNMINPDILSIKYCQTETIALVEMLFSNNPSPVVINLDFISDEFEQQDIEDGDLIPLLFKPESDIIDNATCLIEFDPISLLNCIDHLFTEEAIIEIDKQYNPFNKKNKN